MWVSEGVEPIQDCSDLVCVLVVHSVDPVKTPGTVARVISKISCPFFCPYQVEFILDHSFFFIALAQELDSQNEFCLLGVSKKL